MIRVKRTYLLCTAPAREVDGGGWRENVWSELHDEFVREHRFEGSLRSVRKRYVGKYSPKRPVRPRR